LPSLPSQEGGSAPSGGLLQGENELEDLEGSRGAFIPDEESQFELDEVNKHWCMKNIKRCIEKMK